MKDVLQITMRLTLSCLIAAFVMGAVFTVTDKAKKHNEHANVQKTMLQLLGYNKNNPPPDELRLQSIYRYILEDGQTKHIGYILPLEQNDAEDPAFGFVELTLDAEFVDFFKLDLSPEEVAESAERTRALRDVLKPSQIFSYEDKSIVAVLGETRKAYLLPGEFPGFKTFIRVMVALSPSFHVVGLEIMEHEEDPGLGGEIEQEYFKNQFEGKSFETLKTLEVIKEPLPGEYKRYLEAGEKRAGLFSEKEIQEIRERYLDDDIYSLTGATISSRAVTRGVKSIARKFAYRIDILDEVLRSRGIEAAF